MPTLLLAVALIQVFIYFLPSKKSRKLKNAGKVTGKFNHITQYLFDRFCDVYGSKGFIVHTAGELEKVLHEVRDIRDLPCIVNVQPPQFNKTTLLKRFSTEIGKGVKRR